MQHASFSYSIGFLIGTLSGGFVYMLVLSRFEKLTLIKKILFTITFAIVIYFFRKNNFLQIVSNVSLMISLIAVVFFLKDFVIWLIPKTKGETSSSDSEPRG